MRNLALHKNQKNHLLAANLRRAFSGVVAGNVKEQGIRAIEKHGHFEISGDPEMMEAMDALLEPRFRPTDEVFIDPTSGRKMRVWLDPRSGERRYRADEKVYILDSLPRAPQLCPERSLSDILTDLGLPAATY